MPCLEVRPVHIAAVIHYGVCVITGTPDAETNALAVNVHDNLTLTCDGMSQEVRITQIFDGEKPGTQDLIVEN